MEQLTLDRLNRLSVDEYKAIEKLPIVVVLDNVRSGHNVGSLFRTIDCLGLEHLHLCGICPRPPHKEINKSAIGADASVEWTYWDDTEDCIEALKSKGYTCIAVEQTDESVELGEFKPTGPVALILGNEVMGVEEEVLELVDAAIEIPQYGTKHSFNVSVCAGIVLSELSKFFR